MWRHEDGQQMLLSPYEERMINFHNTETNRLIDKDQINLGLEQVRNMADVAVRRYNRFDQNLYWELGQLILDTFPGITVEERKNVEKDIYNIINERELESIYNDAYYETWEKAFNEEVFKKEKSLINKSSKKDAWEAVLDGELGHDILTTGTWEEVKKQTLKWLKQLKNGYINKKNPHDNKKIDSDAKEQDGYAIEDLKLYDEEKRWSFHFDHGKHPYDLIIQPVGYKESANNWRHGDCDLFAIKAHKDTGWPIYKISEKPNSHAWHFFVMNPETGEALDGAGYRSAEEILQEHDPDFNPEYEGLGTYPEIYKSSLEEAQNYRQGYKESKWKISVNKENNFDETIKYTIKKIKRHLPSFLFGMGEDEGINQRIKIQENLENDSKFDEYYVNNSRFYNPEQLTIYHSKIDETEKERRFSNSLHYYILDNLDEIELNYPTDSWGEIVDNIFEVFDADMKQWWKEYDQGFNLGFTQGPRNFYINQ